MVVTVNTTKYTIENDLTKKEKKKNKQAYVQTNGTYLTKAEYVYRFSCQLSIVLARSKVVTTIGVLRQQRGLASVRRMISSTHDAIIHGSIAQLDAFLRRSKSQIPLRYLVADRSEAGRRRVADLLACASSLLAR